jgi:phosphate transport system substrate-binding protein
MKKFIKIAVVAAMAALLVSPAFGWNWPWLQKAGNKLSMSGSTTVLPIAQKAAEEFMKINKDADVSVSGGGSGVGIAAIIDGSVDIGNSSRSIKSKEIVTAKQKGVNPIGTVIAKDGVALIVNIDNKVEGLTLSQLKGIYSGEIKKWSEVGGDSTPIVVVSRDSASGTFEVFNEKVLTGAKLREDSLMLASNKEVLETVIKTPGAIGYVGIAYLTGAKELSLDGVKASKATVLDGTYKISRPLFMYTNGEPSGLAKDFIDYILSADGQKLVEDVGYVAIK